MFLMGLDDGIYETIRSNVLATDPLPSLNKMYSILVQEESVRNRPQTREERPEVMALAAQASMKARGRENKIDSFCSNCNRKGHDEAGFFEITGYPEWWGERPRNNEKTGGRGRGQNRGGSTGSSGGRGRGPARVHAVQCSSSTLGEETRNSATTGLSQEQWKTLVEMLNNSKVTPNESMTGPHYEDADWNG
ncbi:uncharacterized protein LOC130735324 [Lotus japonicus]|uniref:uncharacterized protein LOC130735324 n=1 Tax=Lotus japonicus TaxID=34305 RepID=UPI002588817D|nr:uncharacterized protein LOC130735324 [Lotus japonicus]